MATPTEPWGVDLTDYKFEHLGLTWCLSIEYEDIDGGYTAVLWVLQNGAWNGLAQLAHVRSSDEIKADYGSPAGFLQAICDKAMEVIKDKTNVPLPTPGDALSRSLYHAKKSIQFDGTKLFVKAPLTP